MTGTVSRIAIACAAALAAISFAARAATNEPFDFDYEIDGGIAERPALIFNDGSKTYLQPRAGQVIVADGGHPEGPYVVVEGTPDLIRYSVSGHGATARWSKSTTFIGGNGSVASLRDDQPAAFDGFSNRLVLIGLRSTLEPVRNLSLSLPVAGVVKALVPQGWTGSAQKDIDLTDATSFQTRPGENWTQALDRLMVQTGLYASVDFDQRHVRLLHDAPKSAALNYATGVREHQPVADAIARYAENPTKETASPSTPSLLARTFGAQAIRDGDDTHTQIRFSGKPTKKLLFTTPDGVSLHPSWDDDAHVVTISRAATFEVSDGSKSVEVQRVAGTVYDFDPGNAAHLEAVFEENGQTFFKFADSVVKVRVVDVRHLGSGEQKGRYYRFEGTADQFIVTADGNTANVTRKHDVKYLDRAARPAASATKATVTPTSAAGA